MTIIITNPDGMTSEWFTSLLSDAGVLKGGRVESVELNAFGGGVMTNMVQAKLSYSGASDAPASVLVKYPSADEGNLGIARIMGLYELEVRFYRDIAPRLQKMSIPKCYTAQFDDGTGRFVLVIEDLSATTKPGTGLETLSEKECSAVLRELANFQAPLWNSPMLGEIDWLADNQRTLGFFDAIPAGLAPYLERFGNKLDPEHVKLFESVVPQSGQWARSWKAPNVLQHGEFRAANVLFGVAPTAPDVTVLDFQTVRVGPPGVDPAYFLGASLTTDDRRCMERRLIESYHRNLVDAGVQRFSWDDCWRSYCEGALYGVFMYVGMAGQVEPSERNDRVILDTSRRLADMAIDLESVQVAGLA